MADHRPILVLPQIHLLSTCSFYSLHSMYSVNITGIAYSCTWTAPECSAMISPSSGNTLMGAAQSRSWAGTMPCFDYCDMLLSWPHFFQLLSKTWGRVRHPSLLCPFYHQRETRPTIHFTWMMKTFHLVLPLLMLPCSGSISGYYYYHQCCLKHWS